MFQKKLHTAATVYWLRIFALYALAEACIQLIFFFILNNYGTRRISIIEFHFVMWCFQCLLIWSIWGVAWLAIKKAIWIQVLVNLLFYVLYSYFWFGPVQEAIGAIYNALQQLTRPVYDRQPPQLDNGSDYSYLNYQLLKHAFRLSWFYLAIYFYNYRAEEKKRTELAIANRELQLKLLTWHLNPSFYFKTINHLRRLADGMPQKATIPILQLARVMEYVIYEAKEKLIDVKKEIQFIASYIQLTNQQSENNTSIILEVNGDHDKLKIAPLLLVAFVDNINTNSIGKDKQNYKLILAFSGNKMQLSIEGLNDQMRRTFRMPETELIGRIKKLYPGKSEFFNDGEKDPFKLCLWLNDE